jgi:hypothetical protein
MDIIKILSRHTSGRERRRPGGAVSRLEPATFRLVASRLSHAPSMNESAQSKADESGAQTHPFCCLHELLLSENDF